MKATSILACLLAVTLANGCTESTADKARPTQHPLAGETIKQVLLDDAALSKMLEQSFETSPNRPPAFGGAELLTHPVGKASSADCLGVADMFDQGAYQSANVKNVASESWWSVAAAGLAKVLSVSEGVVALPTAAEATALFERFSQQWDKCKGSTVTVEGGGATFTYNINDVRVADSVLAATVYVDREKTDGTTHLKPNPAARAIGVRGNCLVEVEVEFFADYAVENPPRQGTGDVRTSGIDIAHAIMDKITKLA